MRKIKIGLALGGGGARGFAHVGAIKALEENGFEIACISGVSIGAIMGAGYAHRRNIAQLEQLVLGFDYTKYIKFRRKAILMDLDELMAFFNESLGHANFNNLEVPLKILTTDLRNMQRFVFEQGEVAIAMAASSCAPYIHKPITYGERQLVDGGLVSDVPMELVDNEGVDLIVGVKVAAQKVFTESDYLHLSKFQKQIIGVMPILSIFWYKQIQNYIRHTQNIMKDELTRQKISSLKKPHFIIEPNLQEIGILDFGKAKEAIDIGYQDAVKTIQKRMGSVKNPESLLTSLMS